MKVKQYNEMMAYLTRPGFNSGGSVNFNGGGSVKKKPVLPKRKPAAEIKRRQKINYEKIKQYLGKESQEFIERELGFAVGGGVNPAQLKQRFMQLVASIQDAEAEEIPGIVAQAKQIKDQIDELNKTLAPDRQIRIAAEGLQFDNPLVDAARIQRAVKPVQGIKPVEAIKSITEDNPAKALVIPDFPKGDKGTLADPEEKLDPDRRVAVDPRGNVVQAGMKGRRTDKTLGDYLKNLEFFRKVDPTATEGSFAEGGSVETPKRGLVDEPGSYSKPKGPKKGTVTPQTIKQSRKQAKELAVMRQSIDNWTELWVKNNINKYKVRDYAKFEKDLKKAWKIQSKSPAYDIGGLSKILKTEGLPPVNPATFVTTINKKDVRVENVDAFRPFGLKAQAGSPKNPSSFFKKYFYAAQIEKNPKLKKDMIQYMNDVIMNKGRHAGVSQDTINAVYKRMASNPDVVFMMSPDTLDAVNKNELFNKYFNNYDDYMQKVAIKNRNYVKNIKTLSKITGRNIAKELRKEHAALKKIFNVTELPIELQYHIDHLYGVSEIVNFPKDKKVANLIANNLIGSTFEANTSAGFGGYSVKRKALLQKIRNGEDVTNSLNKLNKLTKETYPQFKLKQPYRIIGGDVVFAESFKGTPTQEGRFAEYFQTIYKTKEGKKQIIKQAGSLTNLLKKLPQNTYDEICRKLQAKKLGGATTSCPVAMQQDPNKTLNIIEEETKKLPKQTGDEVLKTVNKIRQGLKITGLGILGEVPFELAAGVNPFKRGKPIDEIVDQSILGLYGIGRDLNRPNVEEFVNTTQRAGALKFYDYYKDQARLKEIDKTLRRLSADQPDADTSDLLEEKELIQGRLGTEPTNQDVDDFEIFLRRRAGEFEANKKARGQYGPYTNILQGTTLQSFSDAAEELNIDLGGILGDLVLPERENIVPTTTRAQRRDRDFMRRRAEEIKQLEQNILFPATGSSFAGGGIAKLAGKSSGPPPTSGPTPDGPSEGLAFFEKNGIKIKE